MAGYWYPQAGVPYPQTVAGSQFLAGMGASAYTYGQFAGYQQGYMGVGPMGAVQTPFHTVAQTPLTAQIAAAAQGALQSPPGVLTPYQMQQFQVSPTSKNLSLK